MNYLKTLITMYEYNLFKIHVKDEADKTCNDLHRAILYLRRK